MAKWSSDNVSSGGHVYDRTTGTWAGETQGSVGDGKDHGDSGRGARVIHDANGPVGVQLAPIVTQQPAAGHVGTGNGGAGAAAGVVNTDGPGSAGTGPGGAGGLVWVDVAGKAPEIPGSFVDVGELPPLLPIFKSSNTVVRFGTDWWMPNPWFSDADQSEQRYGEPGDWLGGVGVMGADVVYNTWRFGYDVLGPAAAGVVYDAQQRVTAPIPPQEPVDWGRP